MKGNYLFAFGRTPILSAAELAAVLERDLGKVPSVELGKNFAIIKNLDIDPKAMIAKLGGMVKIGRVVARGEYVGVDALRQVILEIIQKHTVGERRSFGISFLGGQHLNRVRSLGMGVKARLKEAGVRSRYVSSEQQPLSSVVVQRENLLEDSGAELMIAQRGTETIIARTDVVQPFAALSTRDYGRPERDIISGMLPPKLAIILLNLAHAKPDGVTLDPFCGSGTVLQEAEMMGMKKIIGTDVNGQAVRQSSANLRWLRDKELANTEGVSLSIRNLGFKDLPKALGANSVDAIATEPFLGPPLRKDTHPGLITQAVKDTSKIYVELMRVALEILKPGGRIAMIVPQFRTGKQTFREPFFRTDGFHTPNQLPASWGLDWKKLIYGRPDQHVFRKFVVMVKK